MFTYCLNNPVNYSDEDGDSSDSIAGWIGELIGKWIYEIISTDSNETDPDGNPTTNAKIKQTCEAIVDNVDASISVGMGYYGGLDLGYGVEVALGMYATNVSFCYDNGSFFAGQEYYSGASLSLGPFELISIADQEFRRYTKNGQLTEWTSDDRFDGSWGGGFGAYASVGVSVYIGFSLGNFFADLSRIW